MTFAQSYIALGKGASKCRGAFGIFVFRRIGTELKRQHGLNWLGTSTNDITKSMVQRDAGETIPIARAAMDSVDRRDKRAQSS